MNAAYRQHSGRVVERDARFSHVMAIALNPRTDYTEGVIRCITSREGDVVVKGFTDRSVLCTVRGNLEQYKIGEPLTIHNQEQIVKTLQTEGLDFLGLEDPDIWIDEGAQSLHLYFTMPFISKDKNRWPTLIHLGHACGKNLNSLTMTGPTLQADSHGKNSAKECSIAPLNSRGSRYNLFESSANEDGEWYSTVRVAVAQDMGKPWQFSETLFHPKEHGIPWIGGHASPGPLLPRSFIDIGEGKLVGIMNGREANTKMGDKTIYGVFSVGLFVYDYEHGKIDWVSPEPLTRDSEARTITFASQFVETKPGEGILYAHVDDSFVRAYTLYAQGIAELLP